MAKDKDGVAVATKVQEKMTGEVTPRAVTVKITALFHEERTAEVEYDEEEVAEVIQNEGPFKSTEELHNHLALAAEGDISESGEPDFYANAFDEAWFDSMRSANVTDETGSETDHDL